MKMSLRVGLLAALVAVLVRPAIGADQTGEVPPAQVAWQLVGKTLLNPGTGMGQVLGYFTYLAGVPGPMFSGAPHESTASFTLRSDPFSLETFLNGDIVIGLLGPETFRMYLDTTPDQVFENPESFSDGQTLATLNRLPAQLHFIGPVFIDTFSTELVSAQNFSWQGRRLNIKKLTPGGVTLKVAGSTQFLPSGVIDYPVSVSFGAAGVAVGRSGKDNDD